MRFPVVNMKQAGILEVSSKLRSVQEALNEVQGCEKWTHLSPVGCASKMWCIFCTLVAVFLGLLNSEHL